MIDSHLCYLWWHLKSIETDSSISINIGVIDFGHKAYFRRIEWISADRKLFFSKNIFSYTVLNHVYLHIKIKALLMIQTLTI